MTKVGACEAAPGIVAGVRLDLNLLAKFTAGLSGEEYDLVTLHAVKMQLPND